MMELEWMWDRVASQDPPKLQQIMKNSTYSGIPWLGQVIRNIDEILDCSGTNFYWYLLLSLHICIVCP